MSKLITVQKETTTEFDPFLDPVSYLASLGIEAELVYIEENTLAASLAEAA